MGNMSGDNEDETIVHGVHISKTLQCTPDTVQ